ncbi:MAG: hypothetical protein KJP17_09370 [Gammaproteobacteria bacterium]|nr:hypothetical protein [Gammaproteobacteria bacterium]
MCSRRLLPLLLLAGNALAAEGFIVGAGVEADTEDGIAGSAIADIGFTEKTWLSMAVAYSSADLVRGQSIDTWYGDIGIDHWFEPVGVRVGVAYWGDSDILDSRDALGSLYWRGKRMTLAADYEYRDLMFDLPATDFFPARTIDFDANGVGLTSRFELSDTASLSLSGMVYDYSIDLGRDRNRVILELLSFSRLGLINSLVDHRAFAVLGVDAGKQRWQFELATWKGAVDGLTTRSASVRFLTPLGDKTDIELALGFDDSELYGSVTFFSVFLYFYGGS